MFLVHGMTVAKEQGQRLLRVRYQQTASNRLMSVLFVTHGFRPEPQKDEIVSFRHGLARTIRPGYRCGSYEDK